MRRTFSRHMPPAPKCHTTIFGYLVGLIVLTGFLFFLWKYPWIHGVIAGILVCSYFLNNLEKKRLRLLAESRPNECIGSFARSFDCRKIDTWIIRAVYEELQTFYHDMYPHFPFRSTDQFTEDLRMDLVDLEDLVCTGIALRIGCTLVDFSNNPLCSKEFKDFTVGDLVLFLSYQPIARQEMS